MQVVYSWYNKPSPATSPGQGGFASPRWGRLAGADFDPLDQAGTADDFMRRSGIETGKPARVGRIGADATIDPFIVRTVDLPPVRENHRRCYDSPRAQRVGAKTHAEQSGRLIPELSGE